MPREKVSFLLNKQGIRFYKNNFQTKTIWKGDKLKYFALERLKKFIVKNGNIYWGRNEDIIFPVNLLNKWTSALTDDSEKILYVI